MVLLRQVHLIAVLRLFPLTVMMVSVYGVPGPGCYKPLQTEKITHFYIMRDDYVIIVYMSPLSKPRYWVMEVNATWAELDGR